MIPKEENPGPMPKNYYISNKALNEEMYKCKKEGELTDFALDMLMRIAHRAIRRLSFKNHQDQEDCVGQALENILRYWHNYEEDRPNVNALAYFTELCKRAYAKQYNMIHKKDRLLGTKIYIQSANNGEGLFNI